MTLLTCYDASRPPTVPPVTDIVAGYLGGDTPHVWTAEEWAAQPARFRLPIYVRDGLHSASGMRAGNLALAALGKLKAPHGTLVALDAETAIDPGYCAAFADVLQGNHPVILYGSRDTVQDNVFPGMYWAADWTGATHMVPWASMTQFMQGGAWDLSVADPDLPLWDTRPGSPAPVPPPPTVNWQEIAMQALPTLQQGAAGPGVRTIQALCTARGFGTTIDGVFGPMTAARVEDIQGLNKLTKDGVVGPKTWPVLMGVA